MSVFLVRYLETKFPLHQMIVEWCYNIHDSCQRFSHDERIALFLGILTDEVCYCAISIKADLMAIYYKNRD